MPELPEVETVKRGLEKTILGKQISGCSVYRSDLRIPVPHDVAENLMEGEIKSILRRSKYLLIDYGKDSFLVMHLGMSGKILNSDVGRYNKAKHDHFCIDFSDNSKMIFNDPRRFGLVTIINKEEIESHKLFASLGPEPLTDEVDGKYLKLIFKDRKIAIKQALMDSRNLVGVGNIYACEALFRSGINPKKAAGDISEKRLEELSLDIKAVLLEAIKSGGSTLRDYVRSDGSSGYFQHNFRVYGRENQPCVICSTDIKRIVHQGRSTYYCPACQKK